MKVKLCGFRDEESLKVAIDEKCDFLGFIFYEKSPRFVSLQKAAQLALIVPKEISKVAVLVNPSLEFLAQLELKFHPDFFQFHGDESSEFLREVRKNFPQTKIIKALRIVELQDLEAVKNFEEIADLFLFDAKVDGEFGGSGKKFDWKILQNFSCKKSWFLSGGLNVKNIEEALKITGAKLVDISSGIEQNRGEKSPELIKNFMQKFFDLKRIYDSKN